MIMVTVVRRLIVVHSVKKQQEKKLKKYRETMRNRYRCRSKTLSSAASQILLLHNTRDDIDKNHRRRVSRVLILIK